MDNASIILFVLCKPCPPGGTRMLVFRLLLTCIMRFGHGCVGVRWLLPSLLFSCLCSVPGELSGEAEEEGPCTSWGTVSPTVSWRLGDVSTAAFIKVIWTKVAGCVSPWSTRPLGPAVLPIILGIFGGDLPGLSTSASCWCFDKKTASLECVPGKNIRPGDSHLGTFFRVQLVARWPQPLQTGSRGASRRPACKDQHGAGWGLQTPRLCQVQHLCAWRLFVLLG